jgi:hypothetical protein
MGYRLAADAVVALHFAFIAFAVLGGFLVRRWPWVAWLHLPALAWGSWIAFTGSICPLTPLELRYRALAGEQGYEGGFIEHYLTRVIYPEGLTRGQQATLGAILLFLNFLAYARVRSRRWPGNRVP